MVVPDLLGTVSAEQLHLLRTSDGGVTLREGLAAVMGLEEASPHRMAIGVAMLPVFANGLAPFLSSSANGSACNTASTCERSWIPSCHNRSPALRSPKAW